MRRLLTLAAAGLALTTAPTGPAPAASATRVADRAPMSSERIGSDIRAVTFDDADWLSGDDTWYADHGQDAIHWNSIGTRRTIAGHRTRLVRPVGVAIDRSGGIRVLNGDGSITLYARRGHGDVAPLRRIAGPHTGLAGSTSIAVDSSGDVWVANPRSHRVLEFGADESGDALPERAVTSAALTEAPRGVTVDRGHGLIVATAHSIVEFRGEPGENSTPDRVIAGASTGLADCAIRDTAVDTARNLYALCATSSSGRVLVWGAAASGDAAPDLTLRGHRTLLSARVTGIAVARGNRRVLVTDGSRRRLYRAIAPYLATVDTSMTTARSGAITVTVTSRDGVPTGTVSTIYQRCHAGRRQELVARAALAGGRATFRRDRSWENLGGVSYSGDATHAPTVGVVAAVGLYCGPIPPSAR